MLIISAFIARIRFSSQLKQVERDEHVVITKYGRHIAKLIRRTLNIH